MIIGSPDVSHRVQQMMDLYERLMSNAVGRPVYIRNRKTEVYRCKHYGRFKALYYRLLNLGVDADDFLRVVTPMLVNDSWGVAALTTEGLFRKYLEYRKIRPPTARDYQTDLDHVRAGVAWSLDTYREEQQVYLDHTITIRQAAAALSPYFLVTDPAFLELDRDGMLPDCDAVRTARMLLRSLTSNPALGAQLNQIRNEEIQRAYGTTTTA